MLRRYRSDRRHRLHRGVTLGELDHVSQGLNPKVMRYLAEAPDFMAQHRLAQHRWRDGLRGADEHREPKGFDVTEVVSVTVPPGKTK